ncbi:MAG: HU family DNA-binding protein [Candidatus Magasanikbacteria bacterium]
MNKTEFIEAIYERTDLDSKAQTKRAVNAVFDEITETLAEGGTVNITGFGKFEVTERAARKGVNPQTGEEMEIPASNLPKFRAGKSLKEAVE